MMHRILLFFIVSFNIGTLRAQPIDLSRKNTRMLNSMTFPLDLQSKTRINGFTNFEDRGTGGDEDEQQQQREWSNNGMDFRPNSPTIGQPPDARDEDYYESQDEAELGEDQLKSDDQLNDVETTQLSNYLVKSLQRPFAADAPLIDVGSQDNQPRGAGNRLQKPSKKARLYMEYPWKRQNSRTYTHMDYNACSASRRDLFQLLRAVHEARQGNKPRFINFCNRQRPANAVYTNIRFLGRKRK